MAVQYAGQAVFIEQNVDAPIGNRISRFWAAYSGSSAGLPLVIVDSGHQVLTGSQSNFTTAFSKLVDAELPRPPEAEICAYAWQVGNKMRIYAWARNTSVTALLASANQAALHALVYEDKHVGVTGRIIRAAPWVNVAPTVAPGGVFTATLDTPALSGVNWEAMHTVVVLDYQSQLGLAFDMLQAAVAEAPSLTVAPEAISAAIDSGSPQDRSYPLHLGGPYTLSWAATSSVPWLTVAPEVGSISVQPSITISASKLSPGSQQGHVALSASSDDGMSFSQDVSVTAFFGPRALEIAGTTAHPGDTITLPATLTALGDETTLDFSLSFDPTVLTYTGVAAGNDVSAAGLHADISQASSGRLGVSIVLPDGQTFAQGVRQLAVVSFSVAATTTVPTATMSFSDQPVPRGIFDISANALTARYDNGTVTILGGQVGRRPRRHLGHSSP